MRKFNISKEKPIVSIWGIQDGSGYPKEGWTNHFPTHDHALCVMSANGHIKSAIELERVTRIKNDNNLSKHIEDFNNNLPDDFIAVSVNNFNGNAFISANGLWRVECDHFNIAELIKPAKAFINQRKREAYVCSHELAHIGAILPFIGKFENNSLLIHIDGLASQSCFSVFHYINGEIKYLHHGWEPLLVTQIFGFNDLTCSMLGLKEKNRLAVPGRLMGYSSYGKYNPNIREWLNKNDWYSKHWQNQTKFYKDVKKEFKLSIDEFDLKNPFFMDIANVCQQEFETTVFRLIKRYQKKTQAKFLYFSGGAALNIDLNSKLTNSNLFNKVFIPPCCSDTGLALGAASIIQLLRNNPIKIHAPFLNSIGVENKKIKSLNKEILDEITKRLSLGQVMGTCIGFSECGPRALGHRSILAIPTHKKMFDIVNNDIKKREWYRPLAPIIIDKLAEDVFPLSTNNELSRFMLNNFNISDKWKEQLPAIKHVNNTARAQVIYKNEKELKPIYQILNQLWKAYKIPCLINTSFNGPGEPMVHTNDDAINCANKNGIDFLLIDDKLTTYKPIDYKRI